METTRYDVAEYLGSPERETAYLELAFEDGDPARIAAAIGDVARARGMSQLAADAGVSREALYKALSDTGNPKLSTLLAVMKGLGLRLTPVPAAA